MLNTEILKVQFSVCSASVEVLKSSTGIMIVLQQFHRGHDVELQDSRCPKYKKKISAREYGDSLHYICTVKLTNVLYLFSLSSFAIMAW